MTPEWSCSQERREGAKFTLEDHSKSEPGQCLEEQMGGGGERVTSSHQKKKRRKEKKNGGKWFKSPSQSVKHLSNTFHLHQTQVSFDLL